ncbi:hypothetical protein D3C77_647690 [compost metagenome]
MTLYLDNSREKGRSAPHIGKALRCKCVRTLALAFLFPPQPLADNGAWQHFIRHRRRYFELPAIVPHEDLVPVRYSPRHRILRMNLQRRLLLQRCQLLHIGESGVEETVVRRRNEHERIAGAFTWPPFAVIAFHERHVSR